MSDWDDACDPVQPVRERERRIAEKRRASVSRSTAKTSMRFTLNAGAPSSHHVSKDFDEMGS